MGFTLQRHIITTEAPSTHFRRREPTRWRSTPCNTLKTESRSFPLEQKPFLMSPFFGELHLTNRRIGTLEGRYRITTTAMTMPTTSAQTITRSRATGHICTIVLYTLRTIIPKLIRGGEDHGLST